MRPAGLAVVEAAKADGRWDRAYAGPATMVEPQDFLTALKDEPAAEAVWGEKTKSQKYASLHRLQTVAEKNRGKIIAAVVKALVAEGEADAVAVPKTEKRKRGGSGGAEKVPKKKSVAVVLSEDNVSSGSRRVGLRPRRA